MHRQNGEPGSGGRAGIEQMPAAGRSPVIGSGDEARPGSVPAVEVCSRPRARACLKPSLPNDAAEPPIAAMMAEKTAMAEIEANPKAGDVPGAPGRLN